MERDNPQHPGFPEDEEKCFPALGRGIFMARERQVLIEMLYSSIMTRNSVNKCVCLNKMILFWKNIYFPQLSQGNMEKILIATKEHKYQRIISKRALCQSTLLVSTTKFSIVEFFSCY